MTGDTGAPIRWGDRDGFLGRTNKESMQLLMGTASLSLIFISFSNPCPLIPSLNSYLIVFASVNVSINVVAFWRRVDWKKKQGLQLTACDQLTSIFGLLILGIGVWGAVITLPKVNVGFSSPTGCAQPAYVAAFVSSSIITVVIIILLCVLVKMVAIRMTKRSDAKMAMIADEGTQQYGKGIGQNLAISGDVNGAI
jgi:nitric oxide reductase large subunit